jgi:phospholipase C
MCDFQHSNNKQVPLNTDGSVESVQRVPCHSQAFSPTSDTTPFTPCVADLKAQIAAGTGSTSPPCAG